MKIGFRDFSKTLCALAHREHYVALWNMLWVYDNFSENFKRYMIAKGSYPYKPTLHTPFGDIQPTSTLYSFHDLLTVNEVFCRKDYAADKNISVVVDIGSNIGTSALYFLTRNHQAHCYLYEPDPNNIKKLEKNLEGYENRYQLHKNAVSYESGKLQFGIEPNGRYGGLGLKTGNIIEVETLSINEVLESVIRVEKNIDILKLDIEGFEVKTVTAIDKKYLNRIKKIYIEYISNDPLPLLFPDHFEQKQRGSICRFYSKKFL